MSLRRKLAGVILGATLTAFIPLGTAASANECLPQIEPPPECSAPPEDPPPPPDGMMPVGDMMTPAPRPMPVEPIPGQPGERCSTFGGKSDTFAWEPGAWRTRRVYTFTLSGSACIANGVVTKPGIVSFTDIAPPRDPRLKSLSRTRTIGESGEGTPDFIQGEEVFAVFCDDPIVINSCKTYRHILIVQIKAATATATTFAELTIVPGPPPII